jgi:hypothetical protein
LAKAAPLQRQWHGYHPALINKPMMTQIEDYFKSDPAFARQVLSALVDNLRELRESLDATLTQRDSRVFLAAHHKVKTTLTLMDDAVLLTQTDRIRAALAAYGVAAMDAAAVSIFMTRSALHMERIRLQLKNYE